MTTPFEPIAEAALAGLREPAPSALAHSTLVAVGLADDYALMASPVGPLRVAWNARGVSAVEEAAATRVVARLRIEVESPTIGRCRSCGRSCPPWFPLCDRCMRTAKRS
jgi:hypothetical protein